MLLSKRSRFAMNPIEEEDRIAFALQKKGKRVVKLSRGDPAKYFPTPKYIVNAYIEALRAGATSYSPIDGIETLKEAIIKRYKRMYNISADYYGVLVTEGVSEALMLLNSTLVNDGDGAVLFKPYYPIYVSALRLCGGDAVMGLYDEADDWNIHLEHLKATLKRIKARGKINRIKYLLLTNPNNPTGTVLRRDILEEVVQIANEYKLLLISDEIYDELVYNGAKFTSVGQLARGMPHIILNGASKVFDATGFRVGFVVIPESDKTSNKIKESLYNYATMRLSVNTPAQYATAAAINNAAEHKRALKKMVREIEKRANHATKLFNKNPLFQTVRPNGAFYMLPKIDMTQLRLKSDKEFVERLLKEELIQTTRGSGFGAPSHFRIVALPPKEILDYAINKINAFCKKYSR